MSDLRSVGVLRRALRRGAMQMPGAGGSESVERPPTPLLTQAVAPDLHLVSWDPAVLRMLAGMMRATARGLSRDDRAARVGAPARTRVGTRASGVGQLTFATGGALTTDVSPSRLRSSGGSMDGSSVASYGRPMRSWARPRRLRRTSVAVSAAALVASPTLGTRALPLRSPRRASSPFQTPQRSSPWGP